MTAALVQLSPVERLGIEWRRRLSDSGLAIAVRPMAAADHSFVFNTTVNKRRPEMMAREQWRDIYGPKVEQEIAGGKVHVAVGQTPSDEAEGTSETIVGFCIVTRSRSLSMVYVKSGVGYALRGNGVGLMLLEHAAVGHPVTITTPNREWVRWAAKHGIEWTKEGSR